MLKTEIKLYCFWFLIRHNHNAHENPVTLYLKIKSFVLLWPQFPYQEQEETLYQAILDIRPCVCAQLFFTWFLLTLKSHWDNFYDFDQALSQCTWKPFIIRLKINVLVRFEASHPLPKTKYRKQHQIILDIRHVTDFGLCDFSYHSNYIERITAMILIRHYHNAHENPVTLYSKINTFVWSEGPFLLLYQNKKHCNRLY